MSYEHKIQKDGRAKVDRGYFGHFHRRTWILQWPYCSKTTRDLAEYEDGEKYTSYLRHFSQTQRQLYKTALKDGRNSTQSNIYRGEAGKRKLKCKLGGVLKKSSKKIEEKQPKTSGESCWMNTLRLIIIMWTDTLMKFSKKLIPEELFSFYLEISWEEPNLCTRYWVGGMLSIFQLSHEIPVSLVQLHIARLDKKYQYILATDGALWSEKKAKELQLD